MRSKKHELPPEVQGTDRRLGDALNKKKPKGVGMKVVVKKEGK